MIVKNRTVCSENCLPWNAAVDSNGDSNPMSVISRAEMRVRERTEKLDMKL